MILNIASLSGGRMGVPVVKVSHWGDSGISCAEESSGDDRQVLAIVLDLTMLTGRYFNYIGSWSDRHRHNLPSYWLALHVRII